MKQATLFLFSAAFLLATGAAWADDDEDNPFYVAAGIGHVSVDRGSLSNTLGNTGGINGTGTADTLSGGYRFNDYLEAELGYHDYGSPTAFIESGALIETCPLAGFSCPHVTGYSLQIAGRYNLVPDLDGEILAGVLDWHVGSPGAMLIGNTQGAAFVYGVRVTHAFGYGLSLDISYEHSQFTTEETRIGLRYSF